jgi:hypothetical protein
MRETDEYLGKLGEVAIVRLAEHLLEAKIRAMGQKEPDVDQSVQARPPLVDIARPRSGVTVRGLQGLRINLSA